LIVQTNGEAPVEVIDGKHRTHVAVDSLQVADATGAGDTLAGATLAALMAGMDPATAVAKGCAAARALLAERALCEAPAGRNALTSE